MDHTSSGYDERCAAAEEAKSRAWRQLTAGLAAARRIDPRAQWAMAANGKPAIRSTVAEARAAAAAMAPDVVIA